MSNQEDTTPAELAESPEDAHKGLLEKREAVAEAETLNERVRNHRSRFFWMLWLVGVGNNNGYTLV